MSIFRKRPAGAFRAEAVTPSRRQLLAMGCACCVASGLPISEAVAQSAGVQRHLEAARQAAGEEPAASCCASARKRPHPGSAPALPQ